MGYSNVPTVGHCFSVRNEFIMTSNGDSTMGPLETAVKLTDN